MGLTDDLARLHELHRSGALSGSEYEAAKARVIAGATEPAGSGAEVVAAVNALRRPQSGRWVGGVCAGLAALTGLDAWVWRLLFVLLAFWGGAGLLLYVLLWVFVPGEPSAGRGTEGARG